MIVTKTDIPGLRKHITGKVRDVYDLGDTLLIVATDRLSAFDVVLPTGIPDKGKVLTQISLFWFELTREIVENHVVTADVNDIITRLKSAGAQDADGYRDLLDGRSMITLKANPVPIECVVRGYLSGSAWKEYSALKAASGDGGPVLLHGVELASDMLESQKMPVPVFTPATKESSGHDVNISADQARGMIGDEMGREIEALSLAVYAKALDYAASRGIIIADTKLEFGERDGALILIDEILTPDSSRFWDTELYKAGRSQPSFDKQFVRDYLLTLDWDQTYPGPELPEEIVAKTARKYREAYRRIVGKDL